MTEVDILIPLMRPSKLASLAANIEATVPTSYSVYVSADMSKIPPAIHKLCERVFWDFGATYSNRINNMFGKTDGEYVFLGSDDIKFHPGWLEAAMETMEKVDGVVMVNDGANPDGTNALVSRAYIEEFGSGTMDHTGIVLHSGYKHNFCDTELLWTAKKRGRWAYCPDSLVEHMHYGTGKAEFDEVYALGLSSYGDDEKLFRSRQHLWA